MASDRRPVIRAPEAAWRRLGELLQLRRAELGYPRRPAFTREREINIRLVTDIENAYRPNTFLTPTLREIARGYAVTYDSMVAVLLGHDDGLVPAPPEAPWQPPIAEPGRRDADRAYADRIYERLLDLAGRGIRNPPGDQLFAPGSPDAKTWDGTAGRMETRERVWLVADLQRRAEGRDGGRSGKASGDLRRGNVAGRVLAPAGRNGNVTIVPAAWRVTVP